MRRAAYSSPRGLRWGVALVVVLLHVALLLALIRAFAPDFTARVADQVFGTVTVTVTTSPPPPAPTPLAQPAAPSLAPQPEAPAAAAGRQAVPRPIAAPSPQIVIASQAAAPVAGPGSTNASGAGDAGAGTGARGQGSGTGAGSSGMGQGGGGAASKAVKLAGDINSARDYPEATREQRLGDYVVVALTVGVDGRVKGCRIHRASRDSQADQITCRLATERFRFRPATDATGRASESVFGWQQRWFGPAEKN
ncbi:TonB family protein [Novosphingobium sp. PS1R-30]|uniref:TonB family protein n=1 Tax=Novosphingobium anseongense TaxID=3133436 RepID=A0ABU8RQ95_9SPHN